MKNCTWNLCHSFRFALQLRLFNDVLKLTRQSNQNKSFTFSYANIKRKYLASM